MRAKRIPNGDGSPYGIRFECPGCGEPHVVPTTPSANVWGFNEDLARPTLTPSILVHPAERWAPELPSKRRTTPRCHSFVTDGRIQFLGDSTHALAGQTVDLPEIKE